VAARGDLESEEPQEVTKKAAATSGSRVPRVTRETVSGADEQILKGVGFFYRKR
jgi:hypothetical protein